MFVGDVVHDRYVLESILGRGGMGEVFAATDTTTGRGVAIKVVSESATDPVLMARLSREATAAMRIRSDHVPELLDVGQTEKGELYLVMERLHGQTLSQKLAARGGSPLSWPEVSRMGEGVLQGLVDAHDAGVVHRDLKPGNIFLEVLPDGSERARILDFGVCKLDEPDADALTTSGEAVGTVVYMAPEQIRGASRVDGRADLYSFGMVVFEALTGQLPHEASGQLALIASKLERRALSLRDVASVPVPPGVDDLVARCLERRPERRFASAVDVAAAWRVLASASAEGGGTLPRRSPSTRAFGEVSSSFGGSGRSGAGRLLLVLAAAVFLGSSVVLALALRTRARAAARDAVQDAAATVAPAAMTAPPAAPAPPPAPMTPVDFPAPKGPRAPPRGK